MKSRFAELLSALLAGAALAPANGAGREGGGGAAHRHHRADDRHPRPGRQGHGRRLQHVSRRGQGRVRRRQGEGDRRGLTGKPDTAVTKAKKLILSDKVHMMVGGVLATEGYALAPVSTNDKTVYIASVPAADDLTQRDLTKYPYFIRTGWTSSQPHHPLGAVGLRAGLQEDRRDRGRLCVRPRSRRRLPEGVRGLRRADRPEDLAAVRHQGLRALHSRPSRPTPTRSSR